MKRLRTGRPAGEARRTDGSADRRGTGNDAGNQAMQRALAGRGAGLDPAIQADAEARLGLGLGHVRVHRGPTAEAAARGLDARAFTTGSDIVLGGGADRRSLAHELIHVAQGELNGVRGADGGAEAEREAALLSSALLEGGSVRPAAALGPGIHREELTCGPDEPPEAPFDLTPATCEPNEPTFLADEIDVAAFTNETLNAEALRVDDWLRSHGRSDDPDRPQYWTLARRLRTQRQVRVEAGHLWLATVEPASPGRLIGLKTEGHRQHILLVDLAKAMGPPEMPGGLRIMTEAQFHAFLASRGIPMTDEEGYLDWLAARQGEHLASNDPLAGMGGPGGSVLPFGATGETEPWGEENILGGPSGQMASAALAATRGYMDPKDYFISKAFPERSLSATGADIETFIGNMAEESYHGRARAGFGLLTDPLNNYDWTDFIRTRRGGGHTVHAASRHSYPGFDFSRLPGQRGAALLGVQRVSVKTSQRDPAGRQAYYREGLAKMLDVKTQSFQHYLRNQEGMAGVTKGTAAAPNPDYVAARSEILRNSYLAVNADDVGPFRTALRNTGDNWDFSLYSQLYNAELREGAVTIRTASGPQTFASVDQIDNATTLTAEETARVKQMVGARLSRRVISSGITTEEVGGLRAGRDALHLTNTDADVARWSSPELAAATKRGGGVRGNALAAGASSLRGGAGGTLIGLVTTAGVMWIDEAEHPDWEQELAASGGMGLLGGAISSGIEQPLLATGARIGLGAAAPRWLTPDRLKYGGGAFAAFGGSVIMEGIGMGYFEDRDHSGEEIAVRSVRAGGLGVASYGAGAVASAGALAVIFGSAGSGAAGGSVVPGWGTAIGFVVGLGVGAVTYYILDETVPGGRESYDAEARAKAEEQERMRAKMEAALAPYRERLEADRRRLEAEKAVVDEGAPYAAGVDEKAIPAGFGLRPEEEPSQMSGRP